MKLALFSLVVLCAVPLVGALSTPPMGCNGYYNFGPNVTEADVRKAIDNAKTNGLTALGWKYILIDDGWQATNRDAGGHLQGDPNYFPSGMAAIAGYAHTNGFNIGIYTEPREFTSDSGVYTPRWLPGSLGHLEQDAADFAAWGFDFVKFDIPGNIPDSERAYWDNRFVAALRAATNKVIAVYTGGFNDMDPSTPSVLWLWRSTGDTQGANGFELWANFLYRLDRATRHPETVGPGHFSCLDYSLAAHPNTNIGKSSVGMISIITAPLWTSLFFRPQDYPTHWNNLTNTDIIAVHQDPWCIQGQPILSNATGQVWLKPLSDGRKAVGLLNRTTNSSSTLSFNWADIGFPSNTTAVVRDCWRQTNCYATGSFTSTVPAMSAMIVTVSTNQPRIGRIAIVSANVQIDFTAGAGDQASDFTLVSAATVSGMYANAGGSFTALGGGAFRATVPLSGARQFYRIKR